MPGTAEPEAPARRRRALLVAEHDSAAHFGSNIALLRLPGGDGLRLGRVAGR